MIKKSLEIIEKAIAAHSPYAKVALFSGGSDSLLLLELLKELRIELDFVIHVHTGTGLPQTLDFVRKHCEQYNGKYIEASAGSSYERYVLRKGFFGKGVDAHAMAYHLLKQDHLESAISKNIQDYWAFIK
jgi:3'-phosphoadenosine 5'-phosphosulfate sulfotransferase (PAPS reductase)/FAD synthetase